MDFGHFSHHQKCWVPSFLLWWWITGKKFMIRSSQQKCSAKKGVLRNFTKFTGKHSCQSLSFLKKRLWHRIFPANFAKFVRTPLYRTLLDDWFCMMMSWWWLVLLHSAGQLWLQQHFTEVHPQKKSSERREKD